MLQQRSTAPRQRREHVASLAGLLEAIKQTQVAKPRARFALDLGGESFSLNLLPSGYLEVDGQVRPLEVERAFDQALASVGATLFVQ